MTLIRTTAALSLFLFALGGAHPGYSQSVSRPDGQEVRLRDTEWRYQAHVVRMDDRRYGSLRVFSEREPGGGSPALMTLTCLDGLSLEVQLPTMLFLGLPANTRSEVRVRFDSEAPMSVQVPRVAGNVIGLPGEPPGGGDEPDKLLLRQIVGRLSRSSTFLIELSRGSRREVWSFRVAGLQPAMRDRLPDCPTPEG